MFDAPDPSSTDFENWVTTTLGFDSKRALHVGTDLDGVPTVISALKDGLRRYELTRDFVPSAWKCLEEIDVSLTLARLISSPPSRARGVRRSVLDEAISGLEDLEHASGLHPCISSAASGLKFALWHVVTLVGLRAETLVPSDLAPRQLAGVSKAGRQTSEKLRATRRREERWVRKQVRQLRFSTVPSKRAVAQQLSRRFVLMMREDDVPSEVASLASRYQHRSRQPRQRKATSSDEYFARRFYDLIPSDFLSLLPRRPAQ